jgi:hypothetical protein
MFQDIVQELDDLADQLQKSKLVKLASRVDIVSNTLSHYDRKIQSKQPRGTRGAARGPMDMEFPERVEEFLPGSDDADEAGHQDAYSAQAYHKVPVGKDSMSRMLGTPSPADILDRLDIADEGHINIQASRRADKSGFVDEGDPLDPWTTKGLGESGDEEREPPLDKEEVGGTLEFFGFEPEGTLHMPDSTSSSVPEVDKIEREAEEGDHHLDFFPGKMERDLPEPQRDERRASYSDAQKLLRTAAEIEVDDPEVLLNHPGDPQEDIYAQYPWLTEEDEGKEPLVKKTSSMNKPGEYARRASRRTQRRQRVAQES